MFTAPWRNRTRVNTLLLLGESLIYELSVRNGSIHGGLTPPGKVGGHDRKSSARCRSRWRRAAQHKAQIVPCFPPSIHHGTIMLFSHARRGPAVCSVMSQLGVNASLVMSPPQKLRRRLCLVNPARHLESERGANRSHSHRYVSPDWSFFRQSSAAVPLIPEPIKAKSWVIRRAAKSSPKFSTLPALLLEADKKLID